MVARQSDTPQVASLEPDESLYDLFDLSTGSVETASECGSSDPAAEILMVDGPNSPLASPVVVEQVTAATLHEATKSTSPSHSTLCKERNFAEIGRAHV